MEIAWDDAYDEVIASDGENEWHGRQFYDYLYEEVLVLDKRHRDTRIPFQIQRKLGHDRFSSHNPDKAAFIRRVTFNTAGRTAEEQEKWEKSLWLEPLKGSSGMSRPLSCCPHTPHSPTSQTLFSTLFLRRRNIQWKCPGALIMMGEYYTPPKAFDPDKVSAAAWQDPMDEFFQNSFWSPIPNMLLYEVFTKELPMSDKVQFIERIFCKNPYAADIANHFENRYGKCNIEQTDEGISIEYYDGEGTKWKTEFDSIHFPHRWLSLHHRHRPMQSPSAPVCLSVQGPYAGYQGGSADAALRPPKETCLHLPYTS